MNKTDFINELKKYYTEQQCTIINDVLENHFIFRKKNKIKVVAELSEQLSVDEKEADCVYEQAMAIIRSEVKSAKRHPFGERK